MGRALIIGAGGVAGVVIHKCCQNSEVFTDICIASRTKSKCDKFKEELQDKTKTNKLSATPNSTVAAEVFTCSGLLVGSPTLNSSMMPSMGSFLTYLKGLAPTGKKTAAFGTFGWAGGAQKDMEEMLAKFSKEILPGFTCKWTPQPNNLESAEQFGFDFAQSILEEEHEECHCAD